MNTCQQSSNSSAKYSPSARIVESMESQAAKNRQQSARLLHQLRQRIDDHHPVPGLRRRVLLHLEHPKDGQQTAMPVMAAATSRRHFPSADRITAKSTNNTANAAIDTIVSGMPA